MKKLTVCMLALVLMAGASFGQKTYVRLGLGAGLGLNQYNGIGWADNTENSNSDTYKIKSIGLGTGLNAGLAFGYMLSDHVGIELGVNEFIGLAKKAHVDISSQSYTYVTDDKVSAMMLQIVPAIVITPAKEGINPYARIGMIVGILPSITEKYESVSTTSGGTFKESTTMKMKSKLSGGVPIGFTSALGVSFNLGESMNFFAEMVYNGIAYSPSKGKVKEWTVDGKDQLPDAKTIDKEWTFEKEFDADEEIPDGSPDKFPKTSFTMSNVALNIGIKLKF